MFRGTPSNLGWHILFIFRMPNIIALRYFPLFEQSETVVNFRTAIIFKGWLRNWQIYFNLLLYCSPSIREFHEKTCFYVFMVPTVDFLSVMTSRRSCWILNKLDINLLIDESYLDLLSWSFHFNIYSKDFGYLESLVDRNLTWTLILD